MTTLYHATTRQVIFEDKQPRADDTFRSALKAGVDLRGVHLKNVIFHGVLQNVDLRGAVLERCRLFGRAQQCNFSGATIRSSDLSTLRAHQCDFSNTTWLQSKWQLGHLDIRSTLRDSVAQKSDFSGNPLQVSQLDGIQWDDHSRNTLASKIVILKPLTIENNLNQQLMTLTGNSWTEKHFKTEPASEHLRPQGVLKHLNTDALVYIPAAGMGGESAPYDELNALLFIAQQNNYKADLTNKTINFLTQTGLLKDGKITPLGADVLDSAQKQIGLTPKPPQETNQNSIEQSRQPAFKHR